jgi:hypothetical protein
MPTCNTLGNTPGEVPVAVSATPVATDVAVALSDIVITPLAKDVIVAPEGMPGPLKVMPRINPLGKVCPGAGETITEPLVVTPLKLIITGKADGEIVGEPLVVLPLNVTTWVT